MLTIKEPVRKDLLQTQDVKTGLSLQASLQIVFQHPRTFLSICLGAAFTAFVSYGSTAWIPTYFNRTFGWPVPKAGLCFGLVLLTGSVAGILWGGWYADRLVRRSVHNGRIQVGVIAGSGILLSCFIPLVTNPNSVLALLVIPAFFVASPIGASATAVQELMPNHVRALSSAIFLFLINMIGLGMGPYLVAFFTDSVFKDELAIRFSLVALFVLGGSAALIFYVVACRDHNKIKGRHSISPTVL